MTSPNNDSAQKKQQHEQSGGGAMTPHQQRCETCGKRATDDCPLSTVANNIGRYGDYDRIVSVITLIGCASHSAAAEPVPDGAAVCVKCFHCNKQVSTYHHNLVLRGVAVCPECIEKGEDTKEAYQQERERVLKPLKVIEEQYGHLDTCLGDPEWCDGDTGYRIAGEMWRAIRDIVRAVQP